MRTPRAEVLQKILRQKFGTPAAVLHRLGLDEADLSGETVTADDAIEMLKQAMVRMSPRETEALATKLKDILDGKLSEWLDNSPGAGGDEPANKFPRPKIPGAMDGATRDDLARRYPHGAKIGYQAGPEA